MPLKPLCRRWRALGPWERLAVVAWAVALAAVFGKLLLTPRYGGVYPIFAAAGRFWCAGETLYQFVADLDCYRYGPLVAMLLVPFSACPNWLGGLLWRAASAAVLLAALAWWGKALLPARRLALLFLLMLPLAVGNLHNGQSNLLVLGLLLATTAAAATGRWNLAAGCIALACLFKVYPVAVLLLLALLYPRPFAGRVLLALAAGLLLPFLAQRPGYVAGQYLAWWHHLGAYDRRILPMDYWYRDLRLLCEVWGLPLSDRAYVVVQLLAAAAIAALCLAARHAGWSQRRLLTLLLALACCWMTLLGSATESATYVLLAPSLAGALLAAWEEGRPAWWRGGLLGSYVLFVATQVLCWFPAGRRLHTLGPQALAALVFFVLLLLTELAAVWTRRAALAAAEPAPAAV